MPEPIPDVNVPINKSFTGITQWVGVIGIGSVLALLYVQHNLRQDSSKDEFFQTRLPELMEKQSDSAVKIAVATAEVSKSVEQISDSLDDQTKAVEEQTKSVEDLRKSHETLSKRMERVLEKVWQDHRELIPTSSEPD